MNNNLAEQITDRVTVPDVLKQYGYPLGRHKRIPCPIHNGKDSNFCYTDKVFHCWTCGESGNAITLVMKIHGLSFKSALVKMNMDFNLGLNNKRPNKEDQKQAVTQRKIREANKLLEENKNIYYNEISTFHRILFQEISNGNDLTEYIELEKELEQWLDENIEGVVQPWH